MNFKSIPIQNINPAPYNPRKDLQPGDPEYEKLKQSLETFGYVEPIIWNQRTGNLVGGHQRFKILKAQGVSEVLCSVVILSEEQEKALNLALNKIEGDWDPPKLKQVLQELTETDWDMSLTGFDASELDYLLGSLDIDQFFEESKETSRSRNKTIICPNCGEAIEK
ncbi:MAG: ParB N-terminal domain-containing protein [Thermoactinomyces sp.]